MTQHNRTMAICEHHREGTEPLLSRDPCLPDDWRIAECPVCGYWCEINPETGEMKTA